ncbi:hypothetical protein ER308_10560 [Egibacter rhizosphaerae]|uniref:Uncharacterized protein n=1 Tax=Egibacter rhizosphaerae TaxID=1670831 RepID=A0A411YFJ3_9ACTN|nr:permease prefix domain 1-containing protein [Egibacter rhizosphaerae]QBI19956.1 hypothetical protein ER308_10560 [Egibacter rhizosphaerae]
MIPNVRLESEATGRGAIDAYVEALERALQGPRRARQDLLTEARDALHDAADAHEAAGCSRATAERRAVEEFGEVAVVAPGFQAELGVAEGQRTALWIVVLLALQPLLWDHLWTIVDGATGRPSGTYALVGDLVGGLGTVTVALALVAVVACGPGLRLVDPRRVARGIGHFTLATCALFTAAGLVMVVLGPDVGRAAAALVPFLLVPLACLARLGRRCLTVP